MSFDWLTHRSRPVVGVGMKMVLNVAESVRYLREVAAAAEELDDVTLLVLPTFPVLPAARELLAGTGVLHGAQDCHWADGGAHTGSVSPVVLSELGCSVVELGHAERRRDFGEDDAMVARKAAAAVRHGLVPVVCVGEADETVDARSFVAQQVQAVLEALPDDTSPLVVAYEPVWAIGAERPAAPDHVAPVVAALRAAISGRRGPTRVLYGGSVAPGAVAGFLDAGADGVFASRSALTLAGLRRIVAEAAAAGR